MLKKLLILIILPLMGTQSLANEAYSELLSKAVKSSEAAQNVSVNAKLNLLKLIKMDLNAIQFVKSTKSDVDNVGIGVVALSSVVTTGILSVYFVVDAYERATITKLTTPNGFSLNYYGFGDRTYSEIAEYLSNANGRAFSLTIRGASLGLLAPVIVTKNTLIAAGKAFPALAGLTVVGTIAAASGSQLVLLFHSEESLQEFKNSVDESIEQLEELL